MEQEEQLQEEGAENEEDEENLEFNADDLVDSDCVGIISGNQQFTFHATKSMLFTTLLFSLINDWF